MSTPSTPAALVSRVRWLIVGIGLLLPLLSLVPLGSLWLWQNGYLILWGAGATVSTVLAYALARWLLPNTPPRAAPVREPVSAGDPGWTPAEAAAWARVQAIVAETVPDSLDSQEAVLALGQRTVEAVARALHPERTDPLWQFTAPEALALAERVSGRLRRVIGESVPLSDRLTIAQLMQLYRWRGAVKAAESAWDVWRALRVINPATALASEVRERLSKSMMQWGREHLTRRIVTIYVEEVGRAAIDLYAGRLMLGAGGITAQSQSEGEEAAARSSEPLRLLVVGQTSAGKSSLVNALAAEVKAAADALPTTARFTPYVLERDGFPAALLIDSPGIVETETDRDALYDQAGNADLVLWVVAATRAAREADRAGLAGLRAWFAARPNRRRPPVLCVLTHIDRLRPFTEWAPPYDLSTGEGAKAVSIRAAVDAVADDLGISPEDVVPVALAAEAYNVDVLWARIHSSLPDARSAQLVRTLRDAKSRWDWQRVMNQAISGGRVLARTVIGNRRE